MKSVTIILDLSSWFSLFVRFRIIPINMTYNRILGHICNCSYIYISVGVIMSHICNSLWLCWRWTTDSFCLCFCFRHYCNWRISTPSRLQLVKDLIQSLFLIDSDFVISSTIEFLARGRYILSTFLYWSHSTGSYAWGSTYASAYLSEQVQTSMYCVCFCMINSPSLMIIYEFNTYLIQDCNSTMTVNLYFLKGGYFVYNIKQLI